MGILSLNALSGICDRVASQATLLENAINSGWNNSSIPFYNRVHNSVGQGDWSIEFPLINSSHGVDVSTVSGTLYKSVYTSMIQDIQSQVANNSAPISSFDGYLTISGPNLHPKFDHVWFNCIGSHLSTENIFMPNPNMLISTYQVISSGVGTYSSVQPLGTGTGAFVDGVINYAPAKFILVPIQNVTSNIQVNLRLSSLNTAGGVSPASANIFVPAGTLSGTQLTVNCGSGKSNFMYLDCPNIVAAGGGGTDQFNVYALLERQIGL